MTSRLKRNHVFINCPFDDGYLPIFRAIVFAVHDLGFVARCALESDDAVDFRLAKIERIIEECAYGIHDLSRVGADPNTLLPRFNMPFELGLFLGCQRFGAKAQRRKRAMILDSDRFRFRQSISDISGQDIHPHAGDPFIAIREVRDWLQAASQTRNLPAGREIAARYHRFLLDIPDSCATAKLDPDRLTFIDLATLISDWLQANR